MFLDNPNNNRLESLQPMEYQYESVEVRKNNILLWSRGYDRNLSPEILHKEIADVISPNIKETADKLKMDFDQRQLNQIINLIKE